MKINFRIPGMFILVLTVVFSITSCCLISNTTQIAVNNTIEPLQSDYPHWNFENKSTYAKLKKINTFIETNKNQNYLAIFDWDGTLYNENISVKELNNEKYAGQPAWYMWMAMNTDRFKFPVFPLFSTKDGDFKENIINYVKYLEHRTNIIPDSYSKFISTSLLISGMTPEHVAEGVSEFLKEYKPEQYAFLPMLDILQKMIDSGYNVWIITGSNPYFVSSQIKYIEENINYTDSKKYNFNLSTSPYNSKKGHIAGNGLKLLKNGNFSIVYDNRYVKNPENELYIVDEQGKLTVVKNLEEKYHTKVIFAAGNSGGDYYDIQYVVQKPDSLSIAVEPRGKLTDLVKKYPKKIVTLNSKEI